MRSVIRVAIAAFVLTLAANFGYGLAWSVRQGVLLPEVVGEMRAGAPYLVLGLFLATVGVILGVRLAAGNHPRARWMALAAGAGLALLVVVVAWLQGRLDFWLPPNALMALVGGGLGGWVARMKRDS